MKKGLLVTTTIMVMIMVGFMALFLTPAHASSRTRATIFLDKGDCGSPNTNFTPIGYTQFGRIGTSVTVDFVLTNGEPNTTYDVELWESFSGGGCTEIADLGTITTNRAGAAEGIFTTTVPTTITQLFATGESFTDFFFNDTTTVTLTP